MTGLEYLNKYFNDNGAFDNQEDKEWFASLLDDYANGYFRRTYWFWNKRLGIKKPINKTDEFDYKGTIRNQIDVMLKHNPRWKL